LYNGGQGVSLLLSRFMATCFNRIDLNLLRVFHAVMEERSVLRAGQRMCLSQSAVSHALARLREVLDDELFIRTPAGMQPTARALAMAPLIREAWGSLEVAIGLPKFEPEHSTRRFTIAANGFVTAVMVPHLLGLLRRDAPSVDLSIRPDNRIDLAEEIDLGQIDAVIGTFSNVPARFRTSPLFSCDDVLIASSSLELDRLSLERLSELPIAVVSLRGERMGAVDGAVSERGLVQQTEMYDRAALDDAFSGLMRTPRIAVSLPHSLALPSLLLDEHLTAIVPRPLGRLLTHMHPLSMHELPYKSTSMEVGVLWHKRNTLQPAQEWLREMLRRAAEPPRSRLIEFDRVVEHTQSHQQRFPAALDERIDGRGAPSFEASC
jgi:DNA-binding transcriptional LysR family regulator